MSGNSWTHRGVRPFARLLIGTPVTPNQLTWLRVITGGVACLCFACGVRGAEIAGGVVWVFSALLDRADGELARLSHRTSAAGHRFDMLADIGVNTALFIAVGIGLRAGPFGYWSIALGTLCGVCMFFCLRWVEEIEVEFEPGATVLAGAGGFDPDDMFYLIGPLAWAGALNFVLTAGTLVLVPATIAVGLWRWRAARRARPAFRRPPADTGRQTRNV